MPKRTFLNLSTDRILLIDNTLVEVFSSKHLSQVKVSEIVEKLVIARGTFYKYFTDLEDSYHYIVKKISISIHTDILNSINAEKQDFFSGIKHYLIWCSQLDHQNSYWRKIELLTQSNDLSAFKRETDALNANILQEWIKLLAINDFCVEKSTEAVSFLYFIMALVTDTLAELTVNLWNTEKLITEFDLKVQWIKQGINRKEENEWIPN